jgi:hypothetical protein
MKSERVYPLESLHPAIVPVLSAVGYTPHSTSWHTGRIHTLCMSIMYPLTWYWPANCLADIYRYRSSKDTAFIQLSIPVSYFSMLPAYPAFYFPIWLLFSVKMILCIFSKRVLKMAVFLILAVMRNWNLIKLFNITATLHKCRFSDGSVKLLCR